MNFEILYYEAPSDEIFEEVKSACIKIWETYDNTYGYVDEKLERVSGLNNIHDNFMYMVSMFDHWNQKRLSEILSPTAKLAIINRIKSGHDKQEYGLRLETNPFL